MSVYMYCTCSPPNNDFTPTALQKVSDELAIHLYDQVTVDLSLVS